MRTIDEFFSESPKDTLYHYTGIGALLNIVKSRKLWASHIFYLNDDSEISYASECLRACVAKQMLRKQTQDIEYEFLEHLHDWVQHHFIPSFCDLFIFSLSEDKSVLSQWQRYTPHGKGVSIGFSPTFLLPKIKHQGFRIGRCLYDNTEQDELISSLFDKLMTTFRGHCKWEDYSKGDRRRKYDSLLQGLKGDILQVFSLIKDPSFKDEREWRIISKNYNSCTVSEVKFREGASMLVPYIEIDITPDPPTKSLFEEVCIGPTQYLDLSMEALSGFLSKEGVCGTVSHTTIPYRKW